MSSSLKQPDRRVEQFRWGPVDADTTRAAVSGRREWNAGALQNLSQPGAIDGDTKPQILCSVGGLGDAGDDRKIQRNYEIVADPVFEHFVSQGETLSVLCHQREARPLSGMKRLRRRGPAIEEQVADGGMELPIAAGKSGND